MKLWILKPRTDLPEENSERNPWFVPYDVMQAVVIRAESEEQAREFAQREDNGECKWRRVFPWLDPSLSTCEELTADGPAGVIVADVTES